MFKRNRDIREAKGGIPAWLIAEKLEIHEKTFYGWMHQEMSGERKEKVFNAIDEIKKEMKGA